MYTVGELASLVGAQVVGDEQLQVLGVRSLRYAGSSDLSLVQHPRELREMPLAAIRAGVLLTDLAFAADHAHEVSSTLLVVENPYLALVRVLRAYFPEPETSPGVEEGVRLDPRAQLGECVQLEAFAVVRNARIGDRTRVMPHVFIDDDVTIGSECWIGPGAVLMRGTRLGDRVRIQPGAVLGADGFGYAPDGNRNVKVPQVGGVGVGDDVEIGANACVDRGALDDTRVGRGTKVDDLVLVGHGVEVGEDAVLVGQVGLAGGAQLGDRVVMAGQSGVAPFVRVGADVRIGARGGVTRDVAERQAVTGMPAVPHGDWLRQISRLQRLGAWEKRLRALEQECARQPSTHPNACLTEGQGMGPGGALSPGSLDRTRSTGQAEGLHLDTSEPGFPRGSEGLHSEGDTHD